VDIAVTGATGFVGRHFIASALHRGHKIRALVRGALRVPPHWKSQSVRLVQGDLSDTERVSAELLDGADALVHLAAAGVQGRARDWQTTVPVNAVLPLSLLQRTVAQGIPRTVVLGTCLEYAGYGVLPARPTRRRVTYRCREEASPEATDLYGATKAAGGTLLRAYARSVGHCLWYLRMASLYGIGDDSEKFLPALIRSLRTGRPFPMTPGEQLREWLHIDDAVEAMHLALEAPAPPEVCAVNVGTGVGLTLKELALRVCGLMGTPVELVQPGVLPYRSHEAHQLVMDVQRQKALLGFSPTHSLGDGLRRLLSQEGCLEHSPPDLPASSPFTRPALGARSA
jgi:nucleoside-diphosphate-sugar epimerase